MHNQKRKQQLKEHKSRVVSKFRNILKRGREKGRQFAKGVRQGFTSPGVI